jgi:hypothetical protein
MREEIERALDIQTSRTGFRVIPILLPEASPDFVSPFLKLKTWADFRNGRDTEYAYHVLCQGIRGLPVGRWPPRNRQNKDDSLEVYEDKLRQLQRLKEVVHEEVMIEFERKILSQWF